MTRQKRGKRVENELVTELHNATIDAVRVLPAGYSGNHVAPAGDIEITAPTSNHTVELKTTERDKLTVESDDLDQLFKCANETTLAWLAIKFSNREMLVVGADPSEGVEGIVADIPQCFAPRETRTGNLIIEDPWALGHSEDWPSQRAGRSKSDVLLTGLSLSQFLI